MSEETPSETISAEQQSSELKCDCCHQVVPSVRRVALHGQYERLRTPHSVLYACPSCFEKKENRRLGLERGAS